MPSIAIILPTLNEEQTIARVIDDIPREKLEQQGYSLDIIVADSSSDDSTTGIARDKGARTCHILAGIRPVLSQSVQVR